MVNKGKVSNKKQIDNDREQEISLETEEQRKEREIQERLDREIAARTKKLWKRPKGMMLIPLGVLLAVATVISFFIPIPYISLILLILTVIDLELVWYGRMIIAETQCPFFEYLGHKEGILSSDVYLIDIFGIQLFHVGGLNVLIPWIEKFRPIAGFDYKVIKDKKPDAIGEEELKEVPGKDYFVPHFRLFDIQLFTKKERVEFAQSTLASIELFATVRLIDSDRASYKGTDVLTTQVPRVLQVAAWDVFRHTDLNFLIGSIQSSQEEKDIIQERRRDVIKEIMATVDRAKLHTYGFDVFNFIIGDLGLTPETEENRMKLEKKRIEIMETKMQLEVEENKIKIEEKKVEQEKQKGIGIYRRWKAMISGDSDGESSGMSISDAATWENTQKKYEKVGEITIFDTGGADSDRVRDAAITGTTMGSAMGKTQKKKERPLMEEVKDEDKTAENIVTPKTDKKKKSAKARPLMEEIKDEGK